MQALVRIPPSAFILQLLLWFWIEHWGKTSQEGFLRNHIPAPMSDWLFFFKEKMASLAAVLAALVGSISTVREVLAWKAKTGATTPFFG
jgi:hypothetical protein